MAMGTNSSDSNDYNIGSTLSEINVTPLVDVMLVLLIIFMVSAPLMQQGVQVDLPQANAPALDEQEESIILTIKKNKRIYVGEQQLDPATLAKQLAAIFENKSKKEIFIQADKTVPYGFVAHVMADVKNAGIAKVGLVTEPEKIK